MIIFRVYTGIRQAGDMVNHLDSGTLFHLGQLYLDNRPLKLLDESCIWYCNIWWCLDVQCCCFLSKLADTPSVSVTVVKH